MDTYLNDQNCIDRLVAEYRKHGSLVVAFDFDNTVYDYHKKGENYDDVIGLLRQARRMNCFLIVFTANEDESFVKQYCDDNQIPVDAVNANPVFFTSKSRKIYYNILLDDRAGLSSAYNCLLKTFSAITTQKQLI